MYSAAADPNASNDSTLGYLVGDEVINTTTGRVFRCVSNAAGAAIWIVVVRTFLGTAIPTGTTGPNGGTGAWIAGDFLMNTAPAIAGAGGSQYVVDGWIRLTNGNANVLGTDWVASRTLTGT
jgi:hypothetical protein